MSDEKTKHTPGPWRMEERDRGTYLNPERQIFRDVEYVAGVRPTTYLIGTITYPSTWGDTVGAAERAANARLVAAAPELLAALKLALSTGEIAPSSRAFAPIRAAIAKAEGTS